MAEAGPRSGKTEASEWYADGLRFQCTQCGNCCTGPPGAVWFTEVEGRRLARRLGLSEPEFYERYARRLAGRWSLIEHERDEQYDCIFLDRDTVRGKGICSVYEDRPTQCRTWPFWPENLRTRGTWREAKRVTPCPGMDQGPLIPVESIRILRASPATLPQCP
jgi:Fe-S-cluster containining protein